MTQVTKQRIEAGFTCAHPPEVPKFSQKITYIRGLLPSQAEIPPYRTYMKECTVRAFERYGRTSPHVNPERSAAAENLFPVGMPPPAFRGAVSACAISAALRTQKRRHDKQE